MNPGGRFGLAALFFAMAGIALGADALSAVSVEGPPLAANVERLAEALDYLGSPLPPELHAALTQAGRERDAQKLQQLLDPRVLLVVRLDPEASP